MKYTLGLLCSIFLLISSAYGQELKKFAFSAPKMGTTFRILLYATDSVEAATAVRAAFSRVDELNAILSDYQFDSELNLLSKQAGSKQRVAVSQDLWVVLKKAQFFARKSKGAFDISIGPLSKLWRRAMRKQALPESDKLQKARLPVSYKYLKLFPKKQEVLLKANDMKLDLGGIAKGYAVDQALQVMYSFGYRQVLVDGGGDISMGDRPPEQEGWKVEIPALSYPVDQKKEVQLLSNISIATSGDTYRFLEVSGTRYSHIIDPRTGMGLHTRRMLSVLASDGMTADALASTLSVLGQIPDKRLKRKFKDKQIKTRVISWTDK